ncbi:MATE family efflux transporter [Chitinophaga horti]|uniref:MATE family efflux transporter n=1 Tax=Chitinophaga horti TaxID=2920382 RepID=A0ABY6J177_9BACT|nr:MATE family efflux transporter [Chitinophaga horti]UYQ92069.1 MATE family efflux transporter [Chitinophaga horti]
MRRIYYKYREHYKDNFFLAYPVVISQLGHTLVGLSDSLIIGHTGKVPLAAVSLGNSMFTTFLVCGIGMSYGLTPLIAQANGRGDRDSCGHLLGHSLLVNILTGILLCGVILLGAHFIGYMGQEAGVAAQAKPFLVFLAVSMIPLMVYLTFKQFAEGLGFTKQAMNISIAGNLLNIFIGVTLVFGWFGFPKMGVLGVGIATLTDRILMGITMAWYVLKAKHFKPYLTTFRSGGYDWASIRKITRIGTPIALQGVFEVSAFGGAAILVGWIGAAELAAHQIAISLASMTYMMASGVSSAAGIRSGNNLGRKDFTGLRHSAIASYHMVLVLMSVTALFFLIFCQVLPSFYISDPGVIAIAAQLIVIGILPAVRWYTGSRIGCVTRTGRCAVAYDHYLPGILGTWFAGSMAARLYLRLWCTGRLVGTFHRIDGRIDIAVLPFSLQNKKTGSNRLILPHAYLLRKGINTYTAILYDGRAYIQVLHTSAAHGERRACFAGRWFRQ